MKIKTRWLAAGLCAGLLWGCSGAGQSARKAGLQDPAVSFLDLYYPGETPGPVNPYVTIVVVLGVENPNAVEITVEKVDMEIRGAPELRHRRQTQSVGEKIPARSKARFEMRLLSTLVGVQTPLYTMPPLYLTGKLFYSTAAGRFQMGFARSMAASQRREAEGGAQEDEDDEERKR